MGDGGMVFESGVVDSILIHNLGFEEHNASSRHKEPHT
jgi:hypothetical protein